LRFKQPENVNLGKMVRRRWSSPGNGADNARMSERLVNLAWRVTVMVLIGGGGLVALGLGYSGLLNLLRLRLGEGAPPTLLGVGVAVGVFLLCRLRSDLVCE
jgi:hypothetical protein